VSAVWFGGAMGLLDDAIREHLELKRLRGADPGEVAREQKEALDPSFGDNEDPNGKDLSSVEDEFDPVGNGVGTMGPIDASDATPQPARTMEAPAVSDETAEFDMQTVLDVHQEMPDAPEVPAADGVTDGSHAIDPPDEKSLEWEMPGESPGKAT
jgi:hypothetical protein